MDVKFYVLVTGALIEHAVVENVGDLRDLPWGVHDRHVLLDSQGSLRGLRVRH